MTRKERFEGKLAMLSKMSRKQREIYERQTRILEVARDILLDRGYLGLTMDRVAQAMEYSKGTIYQHFSCKEELVMELSIKVMEKHAELFERAATFRGSSRERMMAIGVAVSLYTQLYTDDFRCSLIVKVSSIRDKTSNERQLQLKGCEGRCMAIVIGIIRDAIASGDLSLPATLSPQDLCFALWSLSFGANVLALTDTPLRELGIHDHHQSVMRNCQMLMDGYRWKPLLSDFDSMATLQRIFQEVFPDEFKQLQAL